MGNCLFCRIASGELQSQKVYEDDKIFAFKDINPVAPVHILFIPKEHITNVSEITADNADVVARIFETIPKVAKEMGLDEGYRVITNCGEEAGQTVFHLHFHLIGGRPLSAQMA